MSDNFQSYQTYQHADLEPEHVTPQSRINPETTRVVTRDGLQTTETAGSEKGSMAQLNPHHGTDSILATAQHPKGLPVYAIQADTLITVNGVQAPAAFWEKEGVLTKDPAGDYVVVAGNPETQPEAVNPDAVPLHPEHAELLQAAIGDMPGAHVDAITAAAIGAAVGRLDPAALAAKFSHLTGSQDLGRLEAIQAVYQAQTDGTLVHKFGIGAEDLPAFYAHCRTKAQGQMQDALGRQIHGGGDMSGWRKLATQWLNTTPPNAEALKAAGIPTRRSSHKAGGIEIYCRGSWMSPEAAARAGLL